MQKHELEEIVPEEMDNRELLGIDYVSKTENSPWELSPSRKQKDNRTKI